jgi:hypothetical protein
VIVQATRGSNGQFNFTQTIILRCPNCRKLATFDRFTASECQIIDRNSVYACGERLCPDPVCRTLIFFIWDVGSSALVATYPHERLDFDATNIPAAITKAFEEAISCHASECYIASAIMVRKTLEELCHERGATGANLKLRLKHLGSRTILPQELFEGLDDLRLLGNDAAHIESQEFNNIGKVEVEVGIEFAKEVLKAVYQYADLLAKLRGLKKTP